MLDAVALVHSVLLLLPLGIDKTPFSSYGCVYTSLSAPLCYHLYPLVVSSLHFHDVRAIAHCAVTSNARDLRRTLMFLLPPLAK